MSKGTLKIVLVGDGDTHKTEFAVVWHRREGLEHFTTYIPTTFENYMGDVRIGERDFLLHLWDTAGQEEVENIRTLAYDGTDIFLLFFSYDSVESLNNIRSKWAPEINSYCQKQPLFILVGVRTNVVEEYQVHEAMGESPFVDTPVREEMVREVMADIGAADFVDCCPLINHSVQQVVDRALEIFVEKGGLKEHKRKWWQIKRKGKKGGE